MTLQEFVAERIEQVFHDVAEQMSSMDATEDEAAAIPLTIFAAQTVVLNFWREYCEKGG